MKSLDLCGVLFYYCAVVAGRSSAELNDNFKRRSTVIKVNQEELQEKIKKLKQAAADKKAKAGEKKDDPEARKARKKVKRAQRKLRVAKAYKSGSTKKAAAEAAPAGEKASA
jgi:Skp family chaperone for outer membrane proteins